MFSRISVVILYIAMTILLVPMEGVGWLDLIEMNSYKVLDTGDHTNKVMKLRFADVYNLWNIHEVVSEPLHGAYEIYLF